MPLNQLFVASKASKRVARLAAWRWIIVPSKGSLARTVTGLSASVTGLVASVPHI